MKQQRPAPVEVLIDDTIDMVDQYLDTEDTFVNLQRVADASYEDGVCGIRARAITGYDYGSDTTVYRFAADYAITDVHGMSVVTPVDDAWRTIVNGRPMSNQLEADVLGRNALSLALLSLEMQANSHDTEARSRAAELYRVVEGYISRGEKSSLSVNATDNRPPEVKRKSHLRLGEACVDRFNACVREGKIPTTNIKETRYVLPAGRHNEQITIGRVELHMHSENRPSSINRHYMRRERLQRVGGVSGKIAVAPISELILQRGAPPTVTEVIGSAKSAPKPASSRTIKAFRKSLAGVA